MATYVIDSAKCLLKTLDALGVATYTGTLEYSAAGSNYARVTISDIDVSDIDKYFVLVKTATNTIGVYGALINVSGSTVLEVRTDYRENETAATVNWTAAIIKLA